MNRPEFSRPIDLDDLDDGPVSKSIEADEAERAALAKRLGAQSIERLTAKVEARRTAIGAKVIGEIAAELTRQCVVSLEPLPEMISESFEVEFSLNETPHAPGAEVEIDADSPEPLSGDQIDLGDVAAQQLSLAMDPYPRKPGANPPADAAADAINVSPFAVLAKLRKGDDA